MSRRTRKLWTGAVSRITDHTPASTRSSQFLDLPGEIRNQIYDHIFDSLHEIPEHLGWDTLPRHDRFKVYLNLRLTNRQISEEINSMFQKHIDRLIFYFEDTPALYAFQKLAKEHTLLSGAHFVLRANKDCPDSHRLINDSNEDLMIRQPGINETWLADMVFQDHHATAKAYPVFDMPRFNEQPWEIFRIPEFEEQGFCVRDGDHSKCTPRRNPRCHKYYICSWPSLWETSITAYTWEAPYIHPPYYKEDRPGAIVLEGPLVAVSFKHFDVHEARIRKAYRAGTQYLLQKGLEPDLDQTAVKLWCNRITGRMPTEDAHEDMLRDWIDNVVYDWDKKATKDARQTQSKVVCPVYCNIRRRRDLSRA